MGDDAPEGRQIFYATNPRADRVSGKQRVRMWFEVNEGQQIEIRLSVADADNLQEYLRKHVSGEDST